MSSVAAAMPNAGNNDVEPLVREHLEARFARLLQDGMPRNEALKALAREHGVPRRDVYRMLLVEEEETH